MVTGRVESVPLSSFPSALVLELCLHPSSSALLLVSTVSRSPQLPGTLRVQRIIIFAGNRKTSQAPTIQRRLPQTSHLLGDTVIPVTVLYPPFLPHGSWLMAHEAGKRATETTDDDEREGVAPPPHSILLPPTTPHSLPSTSILYHLPTSTACHPQAMSSHEAIIDPALRDLPPPSHAAGVKRKIRASNSSPTSSSSAPNRGRVTRRSAALRSAAQHPPNSTSPSDNPPTASDIEPSRGEEENKYQWTPRDSAVRTKNVTARVPLPRLHQTLDPHYRPGFVHPIIPSPSASSHAYVSNAPTDS